MARKRPLIIPAFGNTSWTVPVTVFAIVRIEQLYPFHAELARKIDARYPRQAARVWAQEEPRNQGAFLYIADVFREKLGVGLTYAGRDPSASPATGSEYNHKKLQDKILSGVVGPLEGGGEPAKPHGPGHPPESNGSPKKEPAPDAAKNKAHAKAGR